VRSGSKPVVMLYGEPLMASRNGLRLNLRGMGMLGAHQEAMTHHRRRRMAPTPPSGRKVRRHPLGIGLAVGIGIKAEKEELLVI